MNASLQGPDGRHVVVGGMTIETATAKLAEGLAAMQSGVTVFDLAQVTDVDSSGLAVVFGWQRAATAQGRPLCLASPPASLVSLAEVYGVSELLPQS